ncbi:MAG: hypothetical protein IJG45_06200 [Oscillospiraceae bacterium]|nr:hypothetical protein [Oscillospiraceae bacterium]
MRRCSALQALEISPAFIAFLCAYYYFDPARTFVPFLFSVTAHEAGHLLLLAILRAKVHKLRLTFSGAVLLTEPLRYGQEIAAAAAGPAVNALLLVFFAKTEPTMAFVNLLLLSYNLLPFYPLDGGRILRAVLHILLSAYAAEVTERIICGGCCLLLLCAAVWLTCVWHAGLWPVIVWALLAVRIAGTVLPEKRIFLRKELTKQNSRAKITTL